MKTYEVTIEFEKRVYLVEAEDENDAQTKAMELHVNRECSEPDSEVTECKEMGK